ncbi:MAG: sulfate reduction electron transfer complex DsrMKJOP subunit DsrM [Chloroflexi bacterium]|nr:sulfate reduction electron transfer complex DsrMKJOP subunit DsrM [Chloroflexota bacterium]
MKAGYALLGVIILVLTAWLGAGVLGWHTLFGIVFPYLAVFAFLAGLVYRVLRWGSSPVPFHIPAVGGQQKSLPWIRDSRVESPSGSAGVLARLALELLTFRSLLRNERVELKRGEKLVYGGRKYLWLGALAFHWALFVILFRHLRLVTEPVPSPVLFVQGLDGFFRLALPTLFVTDVVILGALGFIVLRRVFQPQVRYISLVSDYFAVLLLLAVAVSGILMRLYFRVDAAAVKELAISLITFRPAVPEGVGFPFYIHLFLAGALVACFPFTKLVHGAGILFSPTRNLKNDSRMKRHANPWDHPVKTHTYTEWEDEFREPMKKAGLPVEKE